MANYHEHDTSWRLTFQNVRLCTILEHPFLLTDPKLFPAGSLGGGGTKWEAYCFGGGEGGGVSKQRNFKNYP